MTGRWRGIGVGFLGIFVFAVLFVGGYPFGCETCSPCDGPDDTAEDAVETWVAVVHNCGLKLKSLQFWNRNVEGGVGYELEKQGQRLEVR